MSLLSVYQHTVRLGGVSQWRFTGAAGIEAGPEAGPLGLSGQLGNLYVQSHGATQPRSIYLVGGGVSAGIGLPIGGSGSISTTAMPSGGFGPIVRFREKERQLEFSEFGGIAVIFSVSGSDPRGFNALTNEGTQDLAPFIQLIGMSLVCFNPTPNALVRNSFLHGAGDNVMEVIIRSSRAAGIVYGMSIGTPGAGGSGSLVATRAGGRFPI